MGKLITLLFVAGIMAGCHHNPPKIELQTVEVYRPILYCPAPNKDALARPDFLSYEAITNDTPPGEVVKRYKASIVQLQEYTRRLEQMINRYDVTSMAYDALKEEYLEQAKEDGFNPDIE